MQWDSVSNLVLVCGHAIFRGARDIQGCLEDANWILQSFQAGEPPFYVGHLERGVRLASEDPRALLVISGGQTRQVDETDRSWQSPWSEAQSYVEIGRLHRWWGDEEKLRGRVTTEEFARDSLENVMLALARFWECTGRFPEKISVVSWEFKADRYGMVFSPMFSADLASYLLDFRLSRKDSISIVRRSVGPPLDLTFMALECQTTLRARFEGNRVP